MTTLNNKHSHKARNLPFQVKRLHKDWRVWVGVGLMLAAMATYVLTLDDSVLPGGLAGTNVTTEAGSERPQK
jgi:hypothetical protein